MALRLNHYSIRTTDLAASKVFYEKVLGMVDGPRPNFPFPGNWMYIGDTSLIANAVVHLIGIDPKDPSGLKQYLGEREESTLKGSGAVDHIAFFHEGLKATHEHLKANGVSFTERTVPSIGLHQLFLLDPSGVTVELNFPAHEVA